jgi:hypothetical protein
VKTHEDVKPSFSSKSSRTLVLLLAARRKPEGPFHFHSTVHDDRMSRIYMETRVEKTSLLQASHGKNRTHRTPSYSIRSSHSKPYMVSPSLVFSDYRFLSHSYTRVTERRISFRTCWVQISVRKPAILTDVLRSYPWYVQNRRRQISTVPRLRARFLSSPFRQDRHVGPTQPRIRFLQASPFRRGKAIGV